LFDLLKRKEEEIESFSKSLGGIKTKICSCKKCGNLSDAEVCSICAQHSRNHKLICVVEDIRDIMAIENTQQYFGVYHVLGGVISPMEGIGPNDLNIAPLLERVNAVRQKK
jgi:recombination protein RecR